MYYLGSSVKGLIDETFEPNIWLASQWEEQLWIKCPCGKHAELWLVPDQ